MRVLSIRAVLSTVQLTGGGAGEKIKPERDRRDRTTTLKDTFFPVALTAD